MTEIPRLLYVDLGTGVRLDIQDRSLCVRRPLHALQRVPLARIARAVLVRPDDRHLQVCLALVATGAVVQFRDGGGRLLGTLEPPDRSATQWLREVAALAGTGAGRNELRLWHRDQMRSVASRWQRREPTRDDLAPRTRLQAYCQATLAVPALHAEMEEIDTLLELWIDAHLLHLGGTALIAAFRAATLDLRALLHAQLSPELYWRFAGWRRHRPARLAHRELVAFVEMLGISTLAHRVQCHLAALHAVLVDAVEALPSPARMDQLHG